MKALIETKDHRIHTWQEWKRLWDATDVMEVHHTLLHFGFKVFVNREEYRERIKCYLDIARGWSESDADRLKRPEEKQTQHLESSGGDPPWVLRRELSRKAFEMLCMNVFCLDKNEGPYALLKGPVGQFSLDQLVELLDFFLEPSQLYFTDFKSLPPRSHADSDHHLKTMYTFLDELVDCYWVPRREDLFAEFRPLPPEVHVRFVDLLDALGSCHVLLRSESVLKDEVCLKQLNSLAMRKLLFVAQEHGSRLPRSLEEASYLGSQAARILLLLRSHIAVKDGLDRMVELNKREQEIARERTALLGQS